MKLDFLRKKAAMAAAAAVLGVTTTFSVLPAPTADASILGAIISTGVQYAQVEQQFSYYNNDGRNELFEQIKSQYGVNNDPELNARLDSIMGNLTAAIAQVDPSINDKPYNYFINNDQSFNAFCSLGHNMSVNTGMFNLVNNDDEVAVVLGHEMGHGQKDHSIKGFRKKVIPAIGAQILVESQGGSLGSAVLGTIIENQANANLVTKPQEWEADNLAFDYITHSSYNPGACAAIWQRVIDHQKANGSDNFVGEIFSPNDHPTNEQRRENYEKKLKEYSNNKVTVKDGVVKVNGKEFMTPAATDTMSAAERSYFVAGNLASVYHKSSAAANAWVQDGTVMLGEQAIVTPTDYDTDADTLTARLNQIK